MILVVTPNPALDLTYTLAVLTLHRVHRVHDVEQRAGGKGLNVARVLAALGEPVTASGFLGGATGAELRSLLAATDVDQHWIEVTGTTRRTVTVVADGGATAFNEAGDPVGSDAWRRLTELVTRRAGRGDVVVVSGSHPPGTEPAHVVAVVDAARAAGARTVVDTSGPLLLAAAAAGADVLKPNAEELAAVTGTPDPVVGAQHLLDAGAGAVVVSLGHEGVAAVTPDAASVSGGSGGAPGRERDRPGTGGARGPARVTRARPAARLVGNPTGAGDAAVAALARALARAAPDSHLADVVVRALPDAVALSGAAVLRSVAGEVDLAAYERMRTEITVETPDADR